jgi:hypothetical protein
MPYINAARRKERETIESEAAAQGSADLVIAPNARIAERGEHS